MLFTRLSCCSCEIVACKELSLTVYNEGSKFTPHCCVFDALAVQNLVPWPTAHCGFGAHVAQKFVPWSMQQIHFRHLYDQGRSSVTFTTKDGPTSFAVLRKGTSLHNA